MSIKDNDAPQPFVPMDNVPSITQEFTITIKIKETFVRKHSKTEMRQWVEDALNKWSYVKIIKVEEV